MRKEKVEKIWLQYKKNPNPEIREKLIIHYLPLVRYVVDRLPVSELPSICIDDLISSGIVGLMEAIDKFDPERRVKFETYAIRRIQGAIIDELRSLDWVPRSLRKKANLLEKTYFSLQKELGRTPTNEELAKSMGIKKNELHKLLIEETYFSTRSLDEREDDSRSLTEIVPSPQAENPFSALEKQETRNILRKAILELSEQERTVITLYYYEDLTLKEIGKILGLSESRISQIHTRAILHLRSRLKSKFSYADIL